LMSKTRYPIVVESKVLDEFKTLAIEDSLINKKSVHGSIQNGLNEAIVNHIKLLKERCGNGLDRPRVRA